MAANHFTDSNLDFWIKNNLNVLLRGKHGVGKTARVLEAFRRNGKKYLYFSGATLDAFVDFIGIPKEFVDEKTGEKYLDLVRPKAFLDPEIEAIFLDEANRCPKKVKNAMMEIIQFKSINGKKFPNLKMVWAAVNPEEDEASKYDVEALDPAQMDRFQVIVNVAYKPDADYFRKKFGKEIADTAIEWWNELKPEAKDKLSPRRLDYVLDMHVMEGDIRPLLHESINHATLLTQLRNGPTTQQLESLMKKGDKAAARKWLAVENNYAVAHPHIVKKEAFLGFFLPVIGSERLTTLMNQHASVKEHVLADANYEEFKAVIKEIAASKSGQMSEACKAVLLKHTSISDLDLSKETWANPNTAATEKSFASKIQTLKAMPVNGTQVRQALYDELNKELPSTGLTSASAAEAIKLIEGVCSGASHPTVMRDRYKNLIPMFAYVTKVLEQAGVKWDTLIDAKTVVGKMTQMRNTPTP